MPKCSNDEKSILRFSSPLGVDLGPVTVVRETTKVQVRHLLREQRKVPGSLLEGSVPLTKKVRKLRSFLKKKRGR